MVMMRLNSHKKSNSELKLNNTAVNSSPEEKAPQSPQEDQKKIADDLFIGKPKTKKIFEKIAGKKLVKAEALRKEQIEKNKNFDFLGDREETLFIKNPNVDDYLKLIHDFDHTYRNGNQPKFFHLDPLLISPDGEEISTILDNPKEEAKIAKKDKWTQNNILEYRKEEQSTREQVWTRERKIERKGKGITGHMTDVVLKGKTASYFAKNNLCIRGNIFKLDDIIYGKSIEEMLPRYGSRRAKHIAVRVPQFTLAYLIKGVGYLTAPVTLGISYLVGNQISTAITLTGEVIGLKFDGAPKRKLLSHAALRGVQLEAYNIPVAGSLLSLPEYAVFGGAAVGIVSTTLAEMILGSMSERFTSSISLDDLGNPQVLFEMNQRIDYLSRFLLPYGQYLLLNEKDEKKQAELKKVLKKHFEILKHLEHQNIKALNFYRLGLMANRIPPQVRPDIEEICQMAEKEIRMNTHRTVRKCLAALIKNKGR